MLRAAESGEPGEPFLFQSKPDRPGGPVSEVVLDEGGIELLWRVHFGFFDPVVAGKDTDGDGITDADEEENWTDPRSRNEPDPKTSPEQRRQDVIEAMRSNEVNLPGKPTTLAEMLAQDDIANAGMRTSVAMSQAAAHARVEAWSKRTGNKRDHFRGGIVTDMEGEAPVVQYDYGVISNTSANVMPLWPGQLPGQSVGSNVTGYGFINNVATRQICGMWEKNLPLAEHSELVGRVTFGQQDPGPASSHATGVAGIIAATGVNDNFKGVAYQSEIRAYDFLANYTELLALRDALPGTGELLLKRMRASNHSYGPNNGWVGWNEDGTKLWNGDIEQILGRPIPEDYHFGLYDSDAREADSTAYALPYHLMVRAAGNQTDQGSEGEDFGIRINGGGTIYGWIASYVGTGPVREKVYVHVGINTWVKESDLTLEYPDSDGNGIPNNLDPDMDGDNIGNGDDLDRDGDGTPNAQDYSPNGGVKGILDDPEPFSKQHRDDMRPISLPPPDGTDVAGSADSLPGGFTVCKNALCVGALGVNDLTIATYSSVGPTDDGRIKPDVVASGGENVEQFTLLGAGGPDDYNFTETGTSFAAPAVAGAVTLLSEWQEKLRGNKEPFRASTFKALICHTATNLAPSAAPQSPPGPNFTFGWGRINAAAAAELIKTNDYRDKITEVFLPQGSSVASIKLRAMGAGKPIKVTISWTDPPGNIAPNQIDNPPDVALKHNINLKLTRTQGGIVSLPWTPKPTTPNDPYPANASQDWTGQNNRDTVEQVYIGAPVYNDEYEIKITSSTPLTAGTSPGQWVSVVMEGLFNPSTVPDGTIIGATVATQSTYVVFTTVMGGYYRLQCQPYGGPWINIDAPAGEGLIRARSGLYTTWFGHNYGNTPVPLRIVRLSPNPFNVTP